MSTKYFYKKLPYVENFSDTTSERLYKDVPLDWFIVVTDIANSTYEIEEGRFKDINFVTAATTTALINIDKRNDFPFVYGGDGVSMLFHTEYLEIVKSVLLDIQKFAKQKFDLELRTGIVPVIDVMQAKRKVKLLKLKVANQYFQSLSTGGGLAYAEYLVKADPQYTFTVKNPKCSADFSGLECVWETVPAKSDEIVSLLVQASGTYAEQAATYDAVMNAVHEIYGDRHARFPLSRSIVSTGLSLEKISLYSKLEAYQRKQSEAVQVIHLIIKELTKLPRRYIRILKRLLNRSDSQEFYTVDSEKFDDMIRMVISGTREQRHQMEELLQEYYKEGKLVYGLHTSKKAYISCFIFSRKGRQVYFIDGYDGGYTHAAKELDNRLKWQTVKAIGF